MRKKLAPLVVIVTIVVIAHTALSEPGPLSHPDWIPKNWLDCNQDTDCVYVVGQSCFEAAINHKFVNEAQALFVQKSSTMDCKHISANPAVMPICNSQTCTLIGEPPMPTR